MKKFRSKQKPTFFWQGVLILLPILLLAAFGFVAIVRDRAAVEEEARERANDILHQINAGLANDVGWRMIGSREMTGEFFIPDGTNALATPPFAPTFYPLSRSPSPVPSEISILLDERENLRWPKTYENPPRPIESDGAHVQSQLVLLRELFVTNPPIDALDQLLTFSERNFSDRSEAGLPISSLALAAAMDFTTNESDADKIIYSLAKQISNHPSVIAPQLMEKAERLFAANNWPDETKEKLNESLDRIKKVWENHEELRGLAESFLQSSGPNKFWMQSQQVKFFCLLQPKEPVFLRDGKIIPANFKGTSVRFFPKDEIRHAFATAILEKGISLPKYFSLTAELENEPLPLARNSATNFSAPVLAQVTDQLTLPPKMPAPRVSSRQGSARNVFALNHEADLNFRAEPAYTLRIHLADRNLLFAQQRQRSILFGALIVFAAVAALVGFVFARRSFYQQLRLNELKSNFVSSVSHELRAPIASVRLLAEGLERGKITEPQKQNEYFKFIVQECRRLSSLIENVLDFSRIEQGRKEYEFEPTDILKLVRETVKLMEPYAAERNVNLVLKQDNSQLSTENSQPSLDGQAIQQALVNLIDNAIKHSPGGATVAVGLNVLPSCTRQNGRRDFNTGQTVTDLDSQTSELPSATRQHVYGYVQIFVEDSGPGIPPREHEKIFERFYRLGSELRRETQGVGIGLSIVKHIVDAHCGKVSVQSEVGKGSRFTMELANKRTTQRRKVAKSQR